MPYTPTVWEDDPSTATPLSAANLNHAEGGIEDAQAAAEAAVTTAADALAAHVADMTNVHGIADTTVLASTTAAFTTAKDTKLSGIEALADVTDATNVAAAGAPLMVKWSGSAWPARPSGATWGVIFVSTNDAAATAPDDAGLLTGDIWDTHPDAV